MLTVLGLVVVAAGILAFVFGTRTALGAYLGALLIIVGTWLQVVEAWGRVPGQCRSWTGAVSCTISALQDVRGKRR